MRRMIFVLATSVAAYLLARGPLTVRALDYSYARIVRLSLVEGKVEVARPDQAGEQEALVNLPLQQGYSLSTGLNGRAEVEFESEEVAELAADSNLRLSELALVNGGRITRLSLTKGTASFSAHPSRQDSFSIQTSGLTVTPVKKSEFRVDTDGNRADVRVFAGEVAVESSAGTHRVKKGYELVAEAGTVRVEENPPADSWDQWAASRYETEKIEAASTERYARAPFSYGLADMDAFGNWYWLPGYGYGWQPWGLPAGWLPFYNGYWGFFPGFGWTWLSYEPWGWVPYHFGRWLFIPGFGWAWLPGYYTYWCPATVYWYQTANWIGWAPLPPGTPYGQTPSAAPATAIVTNSTAGLLGHAPNHILKPTAGTPVTLSAFAPIPMGGVVSRVADRPPHVLAPMSAKQPRALPPPTMENPRRVVIPPMPKAFPSGSNAKLLRQPILVTPKPRASMPQPTTSPARPAPFNAPPERKAPPPEATEPRTHPPPPPHNFASGAPPRPGIVLPAAHAPREEPGPPQMMAEPRPFAAREAHASPPPHR